MFIRLILRRDILVEASKYPLIFQSLNFYLNNYLLTAILELF